MSTNDGERRLIAFLNTHYEVANSLVGTPEGRKVLFNVLLAEARLRVSVEDFEDVMKDENLDTQDKAFDEFLKRPVGGRGSVDPDDRPRPEDVDQGAVDTDNSIFRRVKDKLKESGWGDTVFAKLNGMVRTIAGG